MRTVSGDVDWNSFGGDGGCQGAGGGPGSPIVHGNWKKKYKWIRNGSRNDEYGVSYFRETAVLGMGKGMGV